MHLKSWVMRTCWEVVFLAGAFSERQYSVPSSTEVQCVSIPGDKPKAANVDSAMQRANSKAWLEMTGLLGIFGWKVVNDT